MITKQINRIVIALCIVFAMTSCNTYRKVVYFQDMPAGTEMPVVPEKVIRVQKGDQLSIMVYGDNRELASTFNIGGGYGGGYGDNYSNNNNYGGNGGYGGGTQAYTVDSKGNVKMPVLGDIYVAGMTREEISRSIENELTQRNLLHNPVVHVYFYDLHINVLGETGSPRPVYIQKDIMTLPDLIARCGDLTINGKRDSIMIIRDVEGKKLAYAVDMRSARSLYSSPAYYLQPNDLVYVKPNGQKTGQSTVNANAMKSPSFWISLVSFFTTVALWFK